MTPYLLKHSSPTETHLTYRNTPPSHTETVLTYWNSPHLLRHTPYAEILLTYWYTSHLLKDSSLTRNTPPQLLKHSSLTETLLACWNTMLVLKHCSLTKILLTHWKQFSLTERLFTDRNTSHLLETLLTIPYSFTIRFSPQVISLNTRKENGWNSLVIACHRRLGKIFKIMSGLL
jgi:hypothetical protein